MTKPVFHKAKRAQTIALAFVVFFTICSIIAAGFASSGDTFYEFIHRVLLFVMLLSYVNYVAIVISKRSAVVERIAVYDDGKTLLIAPTSVHSFVSVRMNTQQAKNPSRMLSKLKRRRRDYVRVVVVRDSHLDDAFLRLMSQFPNLVVLDLAGCSVAREIWDELTHFPQLRHVLASNTMDKTLLKELAYTLPEIKFWLEPRTLLSSAQKLAPAQVEGLVQYD